MWKVNQTMKDREFYAKLVFGGRWKKVDKFLASGELEAVQKVTEQPVHLAGIRALGHCGRSAAVSQLNYIIEHNTDETVVAAAREAIRATCQKL